MWMHGDDRSEWCHCQMAVDIVYLDRASEISDPFGLIMHGYRLQREVGLYNTVSCKRLLISSRYGDDGLFNVISYNLT